MCWAIKSWVAQLIFCDCGVAVVPLYGMLLLAIALETEGHLRLYGALGLNCILIQWCAILKERLRRDRPKSKHERIRKPLNLSQCTSYYWKYSDMRT